MKKIIATCAIAALTAVVAPSSALADTRPIPTVPPHTTTWVRSTSVCHNGQAVRHANRHSHVWRICHRWHRVPFPRNYVPVKVEFPPTHR